MISYHEFDTSLLPQVLELYQDAGWRTYLGDEEKLRRALENSLYLLGAFSSGRLVGMIRCIGDGEHILYVQDLVVHSGSRRQGIGAALLRHAMEHYAHVRMFTLITDAADPVDNAFYAAMGMKPYSQAGLTGYLR